MYVYSLEISYTCQKIFYFYFSLTGIKILKTKRPEVFYRPNRTYLKIILLPVYTKKETRYINRISYGRHMSTNVIVNSNWK